MGWEEIETTTHQDHVIKHVICATVLGWFVANEIVHLLLESKLTDIAKTS